MTLSALIARLLGGAPQARTARRIGEHQGEEADGAGDVREVEHGIRMKENRGREMRRHTAYNAADGAYRA